MELSRKALQVSASPTLAIDAKFKAMKADGIDVIGFGCGEPDFDTPVKIREELKRQLKDRNILIHHIQMEKLEDGAVKVKLEVSREHTITCTDLADIFAEDENIKSFRL